MSIQLIDYDALGPDDYAGCVFLDLGTCRLERDQDNIPVPDRPTWTPFFLEKPGDSSGELLVSYQVDTICVCLFAASATLTYTIYMARMLMTSPTRTGTSDD